jgi:hypothetical protein
LPAALAAAVLCGISGPEVLTNVFPAELITGAPARRFYGNLAAGGVGRLVGASLLIGAIVLLMHFATRAPRFIPAIAAVSLVVALFEGIDVALAPAPLLHIGLAVPALSGRWRHSPLPLLWAASLASTARIALNVSATFNGFAYVVPTLLLVAFLAFVVAPAHGLYDARTAGIWLIVFAGMAAHGLIEAGQRASFPHARVDTPRGSFLDPDPSRGRVLAEVIAYLITHPAESLVVFPEGVSLNYFSRQPTPLREYIFTPPETASPDVEAALVAELRQQRPARVAMVTRPVAEFGYRGFGIDYDRALAAEIERDYRIEKVWRHGWFRCSLMARRR